MNNVNPTTQIPYGYISADALDPEVVQDLMYGPQAVDETYQDMLARHLSRIEKDLTEEGKSDDEIADAVEGAEEDFAIGWESDEPRMAGVYEDVTYVASWLGGALNFFIIQSPYITHKARRASPCVPGAAILDTLDGSEFGYDVPASWRQSA